MPNNHEEVSVDIVVNNGQAENNLRSFQRAAEQSSSKMQEAFGKMQTVGENMTKYVTTPLAAVGAIGMKTAMEVDNSQKKIQKGLGVTATEAKSLNKDVKAVWKDGFGESMGHVSDSLITVRRNMSQIDNGKEIQRVTKDAMLLAETFDSDINEVTRGANQLMVGFGISSEEAMDLLASGAQNGLDFSKELFDNVSEYGPLFANMGYSADEYFALLSNGAKNGAYNLDYVNDVMKEFQIRIKDGSKSTSDAMGEMSAGTQKVWKSFLEGKATVKDVNNVVLNELKGMDDQVKAGQIGVSLYGTKWEDLEATTMYSLNEIQGGLGKTTGAMKDMRKAQEESISVKWQKTLREAQSALEPVGRILLDMALDILPKVSSAIKTATDWFESLSPGVQKTVITLGGLALAAGPVLFVFGKLGGIIGGLITTFGGMAAATAASAGATAAAGVSAGAAGTGFVGLAGTIGAATLAIAPWLLGAAAIGVAGYGIYKGLTSEAIPAVDLFKERVNLAADGTVESVDKISASTQKTVGAFMQMSQQTGAQLTTMYAQNSAITEQSANDLIGKYDNMKTQIVNGYEQQKNDMLNKTSQMLQGMDGLTQEGQSQILHNVAQHYESQKAVAQNAQNQINDILRKASSEKRNLTVDEYNKLLNLQGTYESEAVKSLSKNKTEQEVILQNLKDSKGRMNAEMASDAIKAMEKQRSETVKKAQSEYEDKIRMISRMRDEMGVISADQANTMISEAARQRDGVVQKANEIKTQGIDRLKQSHKGLSSQVNTDTGNILTWWNQLQRTWSTWKPAVKTFITRYVTESLGIGGHANGTPNFGGGLSYVNERGGEIMNLPRGTQIIPHDLSKRYMDRYARDATKGTTGGSPIAITNNLTYNGNNPNDAYKMLEIIDQGLQNKVDINNIMRGVK
ncbi:phage tail tape measure protein [Bacillus thuringiensis]|uniref:phage tail tape measure protein n=1 Tax=Bacillus thuringiensis TaxID=1428 RepID=UPI000BF24D20|nr:phage tail tape measure protein [Bacillus thuringiensis]PFB88881.1 phage tail tape measure protein [Bacillus thuringiensis]